MTHRIIRFNFVSRIKRTWLRRAGLIAFFPFMFVFNCAVVIFRLAWLIAFAVIASPVILPKRCWQHNQAMIASFRLRWHTRRTDIDDDITIPEFLRGKP